MIAALAASGALLGAAGGFKFSKQNDSEPAWGIGLGFGMGGGAMVCAIAGFLVGFFIRFPESTDFPGFAQGVGMMFIGGLSGGFCGAIGGVVGGVIGQQVNRT